MADADLEEVRHSDIAVPLSLCSAKQRMCRLERRAWRSSNPKVGEEEGQVAQVAAARMNRDSERIPPITHYGTY